MSRALDDVVTPQWRDALVAARARLELFCGNAVDALALIDEVLQHASITPQVAAELYVVITWGNLVTARPHRAMELSERMLRDDPQPHGHYAVMAPDLEAPNRSTAEVLLGNLTVAAQLAGGAHRQSTAEGIDAQRAVAGFAYGWVLLVIGRVRAAIDVLTDSAGALRVIDFYRMSAACHGVLAQCHSLVGDLAAAEAALQEAEASRVPSFVMDHSYVAAGRAWIAEARGERSSARQISHRSAETCATYGQVMFEAFAWHDLARLGDAATASSFLDPLVARVEGELIPMFAAHAKALAAGDAAQLDAVATAFERMGALLYAAETAAEAAEQYRNDGRTGSAMTAAARARRLADQCEGARTPALVALDVSLPLTPREHEIAGLAARGLSNKETAERLVLSVRTVDNHLHNAFGKLGITHRTELAAIVLPSPGEGI